MRPQATSTLLYACAPNLARHSSCVKNARATRSRCFASGSQPGQDFAHLRARSSFLSSRVDIKLRRPIFTHVGRPQHRPMTTRRKEFIKQQLKVSGKFMIYCWIVSGVVLFTLYVVNEDKLERTYPTPTQWTYLTRSAYRNAKTHEEPEAFPSGVVDWVLTANMYKNLVRRLEDPKIDGAGLKEQEPGGILIEGVGKSGYDIEGKSDSWRRGYYEALMGLAKGAENLDGFVTDTTRKIVFPPDVVIGPSNPNPKPCPPGAASAPLEENCRPAFESPEIYYMRILTTKGFSTRERLRAALAYADWLDFKHLTGTAKEMYRWALDIATSSLERPEAVIDKTTGVIKPDAPTVTPNMLLASTSLATHHARNGDLSSALPIYISVFRARRSLPTPPESTTPSRPQWEPEQPPAKHELEAMTRFFKSATKAILYHPPFPRAPPSGDEQAHRTGTSICEEAGVMANIGEILYASSSSPTDGLSWTRQAVDVAEQQYDASERDLEASEKCKECLEVALENWVTMVSTLAAQHGAQRDGVVATAQKDAAVEAVAVEAASQDQAPSAPKETQEATAARSGSWWPIWSSKTAKAATRDDVQNVDWDKEQALVNEKAMNLRRVLARHRFEKKGAAWFGTMLFD